MAFTESYEFDVHWDSARTWAKFLGLCALVAIALIILQATMIVGVCLILSIFDPDLLDAATTPEHPLASLLGGAIAIGYVVLLLVLSVFVNRLSYRSWRWRASDSFPMHLFEYGKKSRFGWAAIILAMYWMAGISLSLLSTNGLSNIFVGLGFNMFAVLAVYFCSDGIKALFWRVLASNQPPMEAGSSLSSWGARDPGKTIAMLAAISWGVLIVIGGLLRSLAGV